jgi:hypothetical protein
LKFAGCGEYRSYSDPFLRPPLSSHLPDERKRKRKRRKQLEELRMLCGSLQAVDFTGAILVILRFG